MKICILGAGGCFGLNAAQYLLQNNHQVMGIGRSPLRSQCWTGSLHKWHDYHAYHITHEPEFVFRAIRDYQPEVIINFAAQGEGAASFDPAQWWRYFETNCVGLTRLVGMLQDTPLQRFIHIGSSEVYGSMDIPADENAAIRPSSPYSASKAAFDLFLLSLAQKTGFPGIVVRPSNCYTPGQQLHRIIPKALLCGMGGQRLQLHGGGLAEKSYLHATDLSRAIELIALHGTDGEIYNVGPDQPTSIREVVERCADACHKTLFDIADIAPDRVGQDSRYWLNSDKIKALGWKQHIGWDEGINDMFNWAADNLTELAGSPQEFRMRA